MTAPITVRRLGADDWPTYRQVRLAALAADPAAFGSNLARENGFTETDWRRRARAATVAECNGVPVGVVGWHLSAAPEHAELVAMWVDPGVRGRGVGEALVAAVVRQVGGTVDLELGVVEGNGPARSLYTRAGFVETGRERGGHTGDPLVRMRYARTAEGGAAS